MGRLTLDLFGIASSADARHDATETLVGGGPTTVIHDQTIASGEAHLASELGITRTFAAGLVLPLRLYHATIRYLDPSGQAVAIENPSLHHRNETLVGPGDPWLYGRAQIAAGGFHLGARAGITLPLGRTVPDPFVLGDMGLPHEHSQFGTGTVGVIAGIEASRMVSGVHVDASLLTIQTFYEDSDGYQAGDRYAASVGAASALGAKHWRFRATVDMLKETAEHWHGIVHTDDGNVGRVDVLAGVEATWLFADDWHAGISVKLPAYTHISGGQLDALGYVGIAIGTHFHLFGAGHDRTPVHVTPGDWTGLDEQAVTTGAAPLVPVPGKITVFDLWATWCEPCKLVDHQLAEVARRHPNDLAVRKLDVSDPDSPASERYLGDATLPHLEVYGRDGKLLWERSASPLELTGAVEREITGGTAPAAAIDPHARRIAITVTDAGFEPERVELVHGEPVTLVITRKTEHTCATDVHFQLPGGTAIDRDLPMNQAVEIGLPPLPAGEVVYRCGMDMVRGTLVVK